MLCILIKGTRTHVTDHNCMQNGRVRFHKVSLNSVCKNDCKHMHKINTRQLIFPEIGTCTQTIYVTRAPRGKVKEVSRVLMQSCTSRVPQTHYPRCSQSHGHANTIKQMHICAYVCYVGDICIQTHLNITCLL